MAVPALSLLGRVCKCLFENSVDLNRSSGSVGAPRKAWTGGSRFGAVL